MKKVLVTVGTTRFDSLIRYLDKELCSVEKLDVVFQVSKGGHQPKNFNFFEFTTDILIHYKWADVIISHAGAGTIFQLLKLKKKVLMVPNFERVDRHQREICEYMSSNYHAINCASFEEIIPNLQNVDNLFFKEFISDPFMKFDEIASLIS